MLGYLVDIKNTVVKKFGPILGYGILAVGGLAVLSALWLLLKSLIKMVIALAIGAVVVFGVYKLYELLGSKKAD